MVLLGFLFDSCEFTSSELAPLAEAEWLQAYLTAFQRPSVIELLCRCLYGCVLSAGYFVKSLFVLCTQSTWMIS